MEPFQLLHERIGKLLKNYAALQSENERLKQKALQYETQIEKLSATIETLEEKLTGISLGTMVTDDEEKKSIRNQLDHAIVEIDKMLATLND